MEVCASTFIHEAREVSQILRWFRTRLARRRRGCHMSTGVIIFATWLKVNLLVFGALRRQLFPILVRGIEGQRQTAVLHRWVAEH